MIDYLKYSPWRGRSETVGEDLIIFSEEAKFTKMRKLPLKFQLPSSMRSAHRSTSYLTISQLIVPRRHYHLEVRALSRFINCTVLTRQPLHLKSFELFIRIRSVILIDKHMRVTSVVWAIGLVICSARFSQKT